MRRIGLLLVYLAAAAAAIVLWDAHTGDEPLEMAALALWGAASILLGWGSGQPLWALLLFPILGFSLLFGSQEPPIYHEAALVFVFAIYFGGISAALVVISAGARLAADRLRQSGLRD